MITIIEKQKHNKILSTDNTRSWAEELTLENINYQRGTKSKHRNSMAFRIRS
jgi:hypothetical protein